MRYRELIKKIQHESGFSGEESETALDTLIESLAERMNDEELGNFASQLPGELQIVALATSMDERGERQVDIVEEFMAKERITKDHAKKQALSAWTALKSFISEGQIRRIRRHFSPAAAQLLP